MIRSTPAAEDLMEDVVRRLPIYCPWSGYFTAVLRELDARMLARIPAGGVTFEALVVIVSD